MKHLIMGLLAAALVWIGSTAEAAWPFWSRQGTAEQQRARAEKFDPFPDNSMGPAIDGARPRDYQRQYAEPLRSQWERWREAPRPVSVPAQVQPWVAPNVLPPTGGVQPVPNSLRVPNGAERVPQPLLPAPMPPAPSSGASMPSRDGWTASRGVSGATAQ